MVMGHPVDFAHFTPLFASVAGRNGFQYIHYSTRNGTILPWSRKVRDFKNYQIKKLSNLEKLLGFDPSIKRTKLIMKKLGTILPWSRKVRDFTVPPRQSSRGGDSPEGWLPRWDCKISNFEAPCLYCHYHCFHVREAATPRGG